MKTKKIKVDFIPMWTGGASAGYNFTMPAFENKKKNKEYVRKSVVSIGSTSSYTPRSTTGSWLPPIKTKQKRENTTISIGNSIYVFYKDTYDTPEAEANNDYYLIDHTWNFGLFKVDKLSLLSNHKNHKWDYNKYCNSILVKKKLMKMYFCKTCGGMKIVNKKLERGGEKNGKKN